MADGGTGPGGRRNWIGRTLDGRYRIERVLGTGGMGTVYLAHDDRMDRPVVVKVPHVRFLEDEGFRERFEREIRSLTRLSHPRIVKALDSGTWTTADQDDAIPYAVLEYLSGGSLRDRLDESGVRQAPRDVLPWLAAVAEALDFIHDEGVIHRDVKPGNILFDGRGNVFLADFGIAKALGSGDPGLTQTGLPPGSPDYMAPESLSATPLSPAYDQYALATIVYEALSGRRPHPGDTPLAVLFHRKTERPAPLAEVAPGVSAGVASVVTRALAPTPADRHRSCGAFAAAFRAALSITGPPSAIAAREASTLVEPESLRPELPPRAPSVRPTAAGRSAPDMVGGPLGSRPARRGVIFGVVTLVVLFGAFVPLGLRSSATSPFGMLHLALLGAAQAIVSPFRGRRRWIFAVAWPLGSLVVAPLSGTFDRFTIANGGILQNGARFGLEDGPAHVSFIPVFLVQALIVGGGVGRRIVWFVVASVPVVLPALSMVHDLRQAAAGCLALAAFQGIACWLWCRADVRASARASVRPDR